MLLPESCEVRLVWLWLVQLPDTRATFTSPDTWIGLNILYSPTSIIISFLSLYAKYRIATVNLTYFSHMPHATWRHTYQRWESCCAMSPVSIRSFRQSLALLRTCMIWRRHYIVKFVLQWRIRSYWSESEDWTPLQQSRNRCNFRIIPRPHSYLVFRHFQSKNIDWGHSAHVGRELGFIKSNIILGTQCGAFEAIDLPRRRANVLRRSREYYCLSSWTVWLWQK